MGAPLFSGNVTYQIDSEIIKVLNEEFAQALVKPIPNCKPR